MVGSRIAETAHQDAINVGNAETLHDCTQLVLQNEPLAYMATLNNPFHSDFTSSTSRSCFAVIQDFPNRKQIKADSLFLSCFLKGRSYMSFH